MDRLRVNDPDWTCAKSIELDFHLTISGTIQEARHKTMEFPVEFPRRQNRELPVEFPQKVPQRLNRGISRGISTGNFTESKPWRMNEWGKWMLLEDLTRFPIVSTDICLFCLLEYIDCFQSVTMCDMTALWRQIYQKCILLFTIKLSLPTHLNSWPTKTLSTNYC